MTRIIDLSLPIDDTAPEPFPVKVERVGHVEGAHRVGMKFQPPEGGRRIDGTSFPDGMFISHESVTASVHCGTHVDAPYHFGPDSEGKPAKSIAELPLGWCYGNGFVLDMTMLEPGSEITPGDVDRALADIGYTVKPCDIALVRTGADRYFGTQDYFRMFAGFGESGLAYLLDMGIRTVGTDSVTLERPFGTMVEDYFSAGDGSALWPAHLYGRKREYCHIERLANLDKLPRPYGFTFACFPVKIKDAGAAWARAVAIIEDF
ncbi:MAG TPA: cyclase family protein [Nitrospirota bacterium]